MVERGEDARPAERALHEPVGQELRRQRADALDRLPRQLLADVRPRDVEDDLGLRLGDRPRVELERPQPDRRARMLRAPIGAERRIDVDLQLDVACGDHYRRRLGRAELAAVASTDDRVDPARAATQRGLGLAMLVGASASDALAADGVEDRDGRAAHRVVVVGPAHPPEDVARALPLLLAILVGVDLDDHMRVAARMARERPLGAGDELAAAEDAEEDLRLGVVQELVEVAGIEVHGESAGVAGQRVSYELTTLGVAVPRLDLQVADAAARSARDDLARYVERGLIRMLLDCGHAAPPGWTLTVPRAAAAPL